MRLRVLLSVAILLGLLFGAQTVAWGAIDWGAQPRLRASEPLDQVVADLERFVPAYMAEQDIPGVAVALVRDGHVAWSEGFGVANRITGEPVTPETRFAVASNSKVVTAYIALRLVDEGLLSLDEPLNTYLPEPWLPPSQYREAITLRRVLSHSSGLGHLTLGREIRFVPGSGYSYSAVGFSYLQAVLEEVSGQPLEELARAMVFEPLRMADSTFINRTDLASRMANGHLPAALPAVLWLLPFLACCLIVGLVGLVLLRLRTGRWRPSGREAAGAFAVALLASCLGMYLLLALELDMPRYGALVALCGLVLGAALAILLWAGYWALGRLPPEHTRLRRVLKALWSALAVAGLVAAVLAATQVPVPKGLPVEAGAAGSMQATAGDLATFLVELADPQYLSEELAAELRGSQVSLAHDLSWGLGPGIQHSQEGDALWQWGQALDYQSVMIIYPDQGAGVVVMTNSDSFNPDVAVAIAHRALGGEIEPLRRATHLEFNYQGPFLDESG